MPVALERIGWVDGQPVVAQDLLDLEDNIEDYIRAHVHGDGTHAAVPPENIPAGDNAVGGVPDVKAHLDNASIHFNPNTNLPISYVGQFTTPPLTGAKPEYTTTITFAGFNNSNYYILLTVAYPSGSFSDIPDDAEMVVEILSATQFRIHLQFVFTPYSGHQALIVNWEAVGAGSAAI